MNVIIAIVCLAIGFGVGRIGHAKLQAALSAAESKIASKV
jgi:hypothetical protein